MDTLDQTLGQRIDELLSSSRRAQFLSTTGTRAAVEELSCRHEGMESIVRELASEVERLAAAVAELQSPSTVYSIRHPVPKG